MNPPKWLIITFLSLLVLTSFGLGYLLLITQQELNSTKDTLGAMQLQTINLRRSLDFTRITLTDTQDILSDTQLKLQSIEDALEAKQSSLSEVSVQLGNTQAQLSITKEELNTTTKQLVDIKKVYPARDFSTKKDLKKWAESHLKPRDIYPSNLHDYAGQALLVQSEALKDGYRVNANFMPFDDTYVAFNSAVVREDNSIWCWWTDGMMALGGERLFRLDLTIYTKYSQ